MKKMYWLLSSFLLMAFLPNAWSNNLPSASRLPDNIDGMVKIVQEMQRSGTPPAAISQWLSEAMDNRVTNMNSFERMSLPENWVPFGLYTPSNDKFDKWRSQANYDYEATAKWTWENQVGQCGEHACTAYYILKKAGVPGNVRILTAPGHEICVWGMADGANPSDPRSWGPNAYVVDGWLGYALTPEEAAKNKYIKNEDGAEERHINDYTTSFDKQARPWEIKPENRSPTAEDILGDCFIATVTYGSPMAEEIQVLRRFRDRTLKRSSSGRWFIQQYERYGPIAAGYIRLHPEWKEPLKEHFLSDLIRYIEEQTPIERSIQSIEH